MLSAFPDVLLDVFPGSERQVRARPTRRAQTPFVAIGLGALLSALACAGPGSGSKDPAAELQTAVQKVAQAESLKFSVVAESSESSSLGTASRTTQPGATMGSSGGGSTQASGVWARGLPLKLVGKERVVYTQGDKVVHQVASGGWEILDARATLPGALGQGQGQGAAGSVTSDEVAQGGLSATSVGSKSDLYAFSSLGAIRSPAEVFAEFASKVVDVQRTTEGDATVYSGKLTPQGARDLCRRESGAGDVASGMQASGTYAVTVRDGAPVEAVFTVARAGREGDRTIAATSKHTYRIDKVGGVALEVPPQVLELLE
jgi:hypothetical protein